MNEAQVRHYEDIDLLTAHQIDAAFGKIENAAPVWEGKPMADRFIIDADPEAIKGDYLAEYPDHEF